MFRYKTVSQKSTVAWALRSGKLMDKTVYEKNVKQNMHVLSKSGKSQYPLNKGMLTLLESACNSSGKRLDALQSHGLNYVRRPCSF